MGLAASQARFLAITARKSNCEFQSMQLAQQKLSVTRDLQQASQNYQASLSATKLVWEDLDENTYDLTYDIMMSPTAINQYDPYLITDTRGKIVLTEAMFEAAQKAGMIDANGDPTGNACDKNGRDEFIDALLETGAITGGNANTVKENSTIGYTKSGIGGELYDKSSANALTTTAFINYLSKTYEELDIDVPKDSDNKALADEKDPVYDLKLYDLLTTECGLNLVDKSNNLKNDKDFYISKSGSVLSESQIEDLTLGDLLSGKYELVYKGSNLAGTNGVAEAIVTQMANLLGADAASDEYKGLNVDTEADNALDIALEFTKEQYSTANVTDKTGEGNQTKLCETARAQNNVIEGKNDVYTVSLTNMLESFLTNFALAIDGYDCGFTIDTESVKKSVYATDDLNYYWLLKSDTAMTEQEDLITDFYNMLYNQICMNGACNDKTKCDLATTDSAYLTNALKNGQLFISSLNSDGYYYQGAYSMNGHVTEVTDENAIAQAEVEYNVTKSKLNYKEESLDLEMQNLDMEISSLSTEIDTVKNLISKNVEKVFTMFSS